MILTRRQIIETGAATGALTVLASSPLLAQVVQPAAATAPPTSSPTVPARPRVMVDPSVDPRIVTRARAAFDRHRSQIVHGDIVGIADFTKVSAEPRFYLLDTNSGGVTRHLVSHGRGSDPAHTGFLQRFSNQIGSEASSDGAYLTSQYYHGKYGRSMRVRGLDPSNSNAETRAIVVHTAWYAEPDVVTQMGRLGRSEGCFALPHQSLQEVLARLGPGRFLYADRLA
ncbi:murein L,D-transpeptidase catalytic domain family protein [Sphingosinicella terrae]|uniref:murein L,D-transpeptidase catalytic domain family protein n=1 Tax=Sphingosinicella terrae TaxID=2172047 RepID=UPI0025473A66|nr:murein L,D-transpeptidase catalytic domain family protein [Sphingosinicella terrae]